MKLDGTLRGFTATLLLVALSIATAAPAAEANHRNGRGQRCEWRGVTVVRRGWAPQRVIQVRHSSSDFPAIASFFGGLAVGAILSSASERGDQCARPYSRTYASPPPPDYDYYDPYCGERFASLEDYRCHLRCHPHPGIVRVIDSGTGECVHTYNYRHGGWEDADDQGDDSYDN